MPRENILFVLVDQWPAWAFSHLGAKVPTPHIDLLAARGTVFTNAFTSCPLCTPARGALLTGRWACQTGVYDNYGVGYSLQQPLCPDEVTWIDEAVRRGYHVGYFGKWHLGPDGPIERGADRHDPAIERHSKPYDPATSDYSYDLCANRYERQRESLLGGRPPFWGVTAADKDSCMPFPIADRGVRFLDEYAAQAMDKPFFLTVSMNPPHFPHYLPREYAELARSLSVELPASLGDSFAGKPDFHAKPWWPCMDTSVLDEDEWRTVIAFSQAHIAMVDEAIGRVLAALEQHGLAGSTAVVFTADHGDMQGEHNRFDKGPYYYDAVWRVPLVVARTGRPPATQNAFVSTLDVAGTLFGLIAAEPRRDRPRFGRDLDELVGAAERPRDWPQVAFGAYDLYNGMSFAVRAIRDERCKFVWNPQAVDELYDLEADPHEMTNLAGREALADTESQLRARLMEWMREVGDDLPSRVGDLPAPGTIMATGKMGP